MPDRLKHFVGRLKRQPRIVGEERYLYIAHNGKLPLVDALIIEVVQVEIFSYRCKRLMRTREPSMGSHPRGDVKGCCERLHKGPFDFGQIGPATRYSLTATPRSSYSLLRLYPAVSTWFRQHPAHCSARLELLLLLARTVAFSKPADHLPNHFRDCVHFLAHLTACHVVCIRPHPRAFTSQHSLSHRPRSRR